MTAVSVYMEPPGGVKVNLRATLLYLSVITCEIAWLEASIRFLSGNAAVRHDRAGVVQVHSCAEGMTHPGQPTT
jgi:hypothetical protein